MPNPEYQIGCLKMYAQKSLEILKGHLLVSQCPHSVHTNQAKSTVVTISQRLSKVMNIVRPLQCHLLTANNTGYKIS